MVLKQKTGTRACPGLNNYLKAILESSSLEDFVSLMNGAEFRDAIIEGCNGRFSWGRDGYCCPVSGHQVARTLARASEADASMSVCVFCMLHAFRPVHVEDAVTSCMEGDGDMLGLQRLPEFRQIGRSGIYNFVRSLLSPGIAGLDPLSVLRSLQHPVIGGYFIIGVAHCDGSRFTAMHLCAYTHWFFCSPLENH